MVTLPAAKLHPRFASVFAVQITNFCFIHIQNFPSHDSYGSVLVFLNICLFTATFYLSPVPSTPNQPKPLDQSQRNEEELYWEELPKICTFSTVPTNWPCHCPHCPKTFDKRCRRHRTISRRSIWAKDVRDKFMAKNSSNAFAIISTNWPCHYPITIYRPKEAPIPSRLETSKTKRARRTPWVGDYSGLSNIRTVRLHSSQRWTPFNWTYQTKFQFWKEKL